MENNNFIIFRMGKVSRKKQKLTKAAKSAKLDGGDAEIKVENGTKKIGCVLTVTIGLGFPQPGSSNYALSASNESESEEL